MDLQSNYQKKKYPWRLGATSFVIPADLLANVQLLAGLVDDVQLLFFESQAKAGLPNPVDTTALKAVADESGLTYTAHLPGDIRLGAASRVERQAGIDEIDRLLEELHPLAIKSFDLHLPLEVDLPEEDWLSNINHSLASLAARVGAEKSRICIENIDYPFAKVASLVAEHGFPLCLDLGHLLRYNYDWQAGLQKYLPRAKHIHYHGVIAGKDHEAVVKDHAKVSGVLGEELARSGFDGVVTLEMYELVKLKTSLVEISSVWDDYSQE
ncbi:MAG: sugar phosphate isomerase/epimerase [Desulfobulbaceae bacterium]|nr:sugar phosphate isomerase/epimerase [Desulfobulbaceae bacterium]